MNSTTDNIVIFLPIGRALRDRKIDCAKPCPAIARITKNPLYLESINALTSSKPPTTKTPSPASSDSPPPKHPNPSPSTVPPKVDSFSPSNIAKMHLHTILDVRTCDTATPSDTMCAFDPLKIHHIFRRRRFRNPKHITSAADNATLIDTGKPPTTLGAFANIPKLN